jgi:type II secretory pathway pseudopilin PulG
MRQPPHHRKQLQGMRGISLVELAIGLAILGLLLAMTFKGQEVFEQYRQGQFVHMVRTLEAQLKSHHQSQGRWPGDCDRDGWIDLELNDADELVAEALDYGIPAALEKATSAADPYTLGLVCPDSSLTPMAAVNVPFNELKLAGLMPAGQPNRQSASHTLAGFVFLGTYEVDAIETTENRFNAMLLTQVSIATARRLAVAIDGGSGTAANLNRVRRASETLLDFENDWQLLDETEDSRITVVVFFDRIPPTLP